MNFNKKFTYYDVLYGYILLMLSSMMWVLFAGNQDNADYSNYEYIYNSVDYTGAYSAVESGFELLMKLSVYFGFSYQFFLMIYSSIGLILIINSLKAYTNNVNVVLGLYFIFPFMLDIVQIRNFMSMAILIYSFKYLLEVSKGATLKYIFAILIASQFHVSSIYYLLFILIKYISVKKTIYISIGVTIAGFILQSTILNFVLQILKMERYSLYFANTTPLYGIALFLLYYLAVLLLLKISINKNSNSQQLFFSNIVLKANILLFPTLILIVQDIDFFRLLRNMMVINYVVFCFNFSFQRISLEKEKTMFGTIILLFVSISAYIFIYAQTFESVVVKIFTENYFLNLL